MIVKKRTEKQKNKQTDAERKERKNKAKREDLEYDIYWTSKLHIFYLKLDGHLRINLTSTLKDAMSLRKSCWKTAELRWVRKEILTQT